MSKTGIFFIIVGIAILLNISCAGKTAKVLVVTDRQNGIQYDLQEFTNAIAQFFNTNYQHKAVVTNFYIESDFIDIETDPVIFITQHINHNKEIGFLLAIQPRTYEAYDQVRYKMLFASSFSTPSGRQVIGEQLIDPLSGLENLKSLFRNKKFELSNVILLWNKEPQGIPVDYSILDYVPYTELITMSGQYVLITAVDGLWKEGQLKVEHIMNNGLFQPEKNNKLKNLYQKLKSDGLLEWFYINGTHQRNDKKLILFEYLTTGARYINMLYGPLKPEEFGIIRAELQSKGYQASKMLVHPFDFQ